MFNRTHFSHAIYLTFVFLFIFLCAYSHAQPVTVSIPKDLTAPLGGSGVKVPVNVTDLTGLEVIGINLTVSYDTTILTATSLTVADTIAENSAVNSNIGKDNGIIKIGMMQVAPPFSDSGTLVFIFFAVDSTNLNDSSNLSITEASFNSGDVATETDDGKITIVETPPADFVTISIPPNITTTVGAKGVQVPVNATLVTGMGVIGAELTIGYDTKVLTATGATLAGTIANGGAVATNIDDVNGEIALAITRAQPLDEDGVIVFIVFDVDSDNPMDSSKLAFLKTRLMNNDGEVANVARDGDIALPVSLSSFVAVADVRRNRVILIWQTESELNHLGFAIHRSKRKNGPYTKIGWVAREKDTQPPFRYRFIDETAEKGQVYFYMLEHIDIAGKAERSDAIQFDWSKKYQLITTWGKLKNR